MIRAVIDTNVLVSALFTKNPSSPPGRILDALLAGKIAALHEEKIIAEYRDVLSREQFHFPPERVAAVIQTILDYGEEVIPADSKEHFPDLDDKVFYCVALADPDARLVTGNTKHFPSAPFVVTPRDFCNLAGI